MADYWIASGLLTHRDAVNARNELLEDASIFAGLEDGHDLEVDCYYTTTDKQLRYGVKLVHPEDE